MLDCAGNVEVLATIEELGKAFPVLNYLIPVVVGLVFAQKEVKKRHKKNDEQRAEDLEYRRAHEIADMAHRKATIDAMDTLSNTVKDLSTTMSTHMTKTDARFEQIQLVQVDLQNKYVALETQIQTGKVHLPMDEVQRLAQKVSQEVPNLTEPKP